MYVALKNALGILKDLVDDFDLAINEQCYAYGECDMYQEIFDRNMLVINVEYDRKYSQWCTNREHALLMQSKWCDGDGQGGLCRRRQLNGDYWVNCFTATEPPSDPPVTPVICFPGDAMGEVHGSGLTQLQNVRLGDHVKVATTKFSQNFSFGHYDPEIRAEYLSIKVMGMEIPLVISAQHMVFLADGMVIPSCMLVVGDNIRLEEGIASITNISHVIRRDAFAPFTMDGTIIVNGFKVSSFISLQTDLGNLCIGGVEVLGMHSLAHLFQAAPHRLACKLSRKLCVTENYIDGLSVWIRTPLNVSQWLLSQETTNLLLELMLILSFLVLVLVTAVVEAIIDDFAKVAFVLVLVGTFGVVSWRKEKLYDH
jgi:hypothetical protein